MQGRRQFLGSLAGGLAAAPSRPPLNFVFILIDDLGWTDVACYGSKYHRTPNIDRLAAQGVRFTSAYSAAPLCSATRASIMTGKSPARLQLTTALPGVLRARPTQQYVAPPMPPGLPVEEITIADALKPAGYTSACAGKWHLGMEESLFPERQGFDVNVGRSGTGMALSFFYPRWKEPGRRSIQLEGQEGDYLTDRLTDEALKFVEAQKEKPFFLYLAHFAVHTFIQGKPDKVEKYRGLLDPALTHKHPGYAAMMESVDESVGRVMGKLKDLKLDDRTIVIFASDNGGEDQVQGFTRDPLPPTSNVPLRLGKNTLYEGGIRVPLIVSGPGVRQGVICDEPVISADFLPTIA